MYFFEENLMEIDDGEQILWDALSSIYQLQHFDQGRSKHEILDVIESHRQFLLKEMGEGADER
jgi:hypothetical protein